MQNNIPEQLPVQNQIPINIIVINGQEINLEQLMQNNLIAQQQFRDNPPFHRQNLHHQPQNQ